MLGAGAKKRYIGVCDHGLGSYPGLLIGPASVSALAGPPEPIAGRFLYPTKDLPETAPIIAPTARLAPAGAPTLLSMVVSVSSISV